MPDDVWFLLEEAGLHFPLLALSSHFLLADDFFCTNDNFITICFPPTALI